MASKMMRNEGCTGNCANCRFASGAQIHRQLIEVAVLGAKGSEEPRTLSFLNYCVRLHFLPEVSSILDNYTDVVLNLVDSLDLYNGLYPATKLIDMGIATVTVLENYDKLLSTSHSINFEKLEQLTGFPVMAGNLTDDMQLPSILAAIAQVFEDGLPKQVKLPYGRDVEEAVEELSSEIHKYNSDFHSDRYLALRLLEKQDYILPYVDALQNADHIYALTDICISQLEREFGEPAEKLIHDARHGYINGALQETLTHSKDNSDHTGAQKIDSILTNKWLGLPILISVLFLVFEATFFLGSYPQAWLESGVDALAGALHGVLLSEGWLSSMLIDGIVQGVGAVVAFLPNIIILFFFLSILEDSGYMARAAYIMDKIMHRIGLHGRSFIPMLLGFGCNVPAIMAARSIDDRKDRTLTMLMIPFMSCSARLPVYMLFISAFFVRYKALVMIGIYATGIALSILFAFVMKRTKWFRKKEEDYVSELPAFRWPTLRNTGAHIWERVSDYLKKISTVILAASVVIWALEYFPTDRTEGGVNEEESYLSDIGRWMEPVMRPLGFDWRMNVCILTGLPAKEAIVSTMGILYNADDESLPQTLRNETYKSGPHAGEHVFTTGVSLAFMVFVLLYFPCIATIATLKREIGGRWALFTVVHSLLLAWVMAFIVFHLF